MQCTVEAWRSKLDIVDHFEVASDGLTEGLLVRRAVVQLPEGASVPFPKAVLGAEGDWELAGEETRFAAQRHVQACGLDGWSGDGFGLSVIQSRQLRDEERNVDRPLAGWGSRGHGSRGLMDVTVWGSGGR